MEATKRPWKLEGPKHEGHTASVMGADGQLIVNLGDGGNGRDVQLANADIIVRAVNTFDQAREALKAIEMAYENRGEETSLYVWNERMKQAIYQVRKALAAMEDAGR